ncbi:MAG: hypothetical protein NC412_01560 [Roseburia sp.]|nr:hypothetical protein [Roseburia sp.]MCM1277944.1 hypothetical protein [Robinsoniella sp.]
MERYTKELKNIQKSIRMSEKVYFYVNNQEGEGFNNKLENLICRQKPFLEKEIKELQKEKETLEQEVYQLREVIMEMEKVLDGFSQVKKFFEKD